MRSSSAWRLNSLVRRQAGSNKRQLDEINQLRWQRLEVLWHRHFSFRAARAGCAGGWVSRSLNRSWWVGAVAAAFRWSTLSTRLSRAPDRVTFRVTGGARNAESEHSCGFPAAV